MKKNNKTCVLQFKKTYFPYYSFLTGPLASIAKMICRAWEDTPITF